MLGKKFFFIFFSGLKSLSRVSECERKKFFFLLRKTFFPSDRLNAKTFSFSTSYPPPTPSQRNENERKVLKAKHIVVSLITKKNKMKRYRTTICFPHNFYHHNRRTLLTVSPYEISLLIRSKITFPPSSAV